MYHENIQKKKYSIEGKLLQKFFGDKLLLYAPYAKLRKSEDFLFKKIRRFSA